MLLTMRQETVTVSSLVFQAAAPPSLHHYA